jgi:hypothetical protein
MNKIYTVTFVWDTYDPDTILENVVAESEKEAVATAKRMISDELAKTVVEIRVDEIDEQS